MSLRERLYGVVHSHVHYATWIKPRDISFASLQSCFPCVCAVPSASWLHKKGPLKHTNPCSSSRRACLPADYLIQPFPRRPGKSLFMRPCPSLSIYNQVWPRVHVDKGYSVSRVWVNSSQEFIMSPYSHSITHDLPSPWCFRSLSLQSRHTFTNARLLHTLGRAYNMCVCTAMCVYMHVFAWIKSPAALSVLVSAPLLGF